ncbi:hypothetical protein DIPPA_26755, partial [Diplonema papillatum]
RVLEAVVDQWVPRRAAVERAAVEVDRRPAGVERRDAEQGVRRREGGQAVGAEAARVQRGGRERRARDEGAGGAAGVQAGVYEARVRRARHTGGAPRARQLRREEADPRQQAPRRLRRRRAVDGVRRECGALA